MPIHPSMPSPSPSPVCAHPSDVALIKDFLRPWVSSGAVTSSGFVHAADLYSAEPQELARLFPAAVAPDGERAWYFLTRLRNKSLRGRRKARVAGQGWWHGEAGPKDVVDALDCNRVILGQRQTFSFMRRKGRDGMPVRTGWIMVEHHLRHQGLGVLVEGLVLCKVYRSPRHHDDAHEEGVWCSAASSLLPSGCKRKSAADHEHDSYSNDAATPSENPDGEVSGGAATAAPAACRVAAPAAGLDKKEASADDDDNSSARTSPTPKKMKAAAAAAGDDEDSSSSPPPAPMMMTEEDEAAAVADDEDSAAPPPAPIKMKAAAATVYYEDSSSPPPAPKKMKSAAEADDDESFGAAEADDDESFGAEEADGDESFGAASADNGRESSDSPAAAAVAVLHCPQCGFHLGALQALVTPAQSESWTATAAGIARAVYAPVHQLGDAGKDHHFVQYFI